MIRLIAGVQGHVPGDMHQRQGRGVRLGHPGQGISGPRPSRDQGYPRPSGQIAVHPGHKSRIALMLNHNMAELRRIGQGVENRQDVRTGQTEDKFYIFFLERLYHRLGGTHVFCCHRIAPAKIRVWVWFISLKNGFTKLAIFAKGAVKREA